MTRPAAPSRKPGRDWPSISEMTGPQMADEIMMLRAEVTQLRKLSAGQREIITGARGAVALLQAVLRANPMDMGQE